MNETMPLFVALLLWFALDLGLLASVRGDI